MTALERYELLERIEKAVDAEPLDRESATKIAHYLEHAPHEILEPLMEAACELGIRGHGAEITVSRNIFIPLTNLCRNRCSYCTFAKGQKSPEVRNYLLEEVRSAVREGLRAGCSEALFCLGDKPEIAYRSYREWLGEQGYPSTAAYLVDACRVAYEEGMYPHSNAGIMTPEELVELRPWNASMGLMLETTSARLREKGQAHYWAPDKDPEKRIRMTRDAGELKIPFTSGILIGIGETPEERIDTLFAIDALHREYGHIQEVIVQNFHPKPGTRMERVPSPSDELMAGTVSLARLIFGPEQNLQAPPNLSPSSLELLVRSGLNDWGGVSPVTIDFINPEAPWPELAELASRTEAAGYDLRERLCVYPEYLREQPEFFDPELLSRLRSDCDEEGYPTGRTFLREQS
ncbi:MAG: 7,8-didemethyl-8-hydroxy-5-deazariboflavin synthase CofG [Myxococcota bacterium]|nr:7,8-didemethyl-8-hydroxy-5-deazariboflavin synthase CofG [Myxococcota bacterium]